MIHERAFPMKSASPDAPRHRRGRVTACERDVVGTPRQAMRQLVGGCPDHWWSPTARRTAACTCDRFYHPRIAATAPAPSAGRGSLVGGGPSQSSEQSYGPSAGGCGAEPSNAQANTNARASTSQSDSNGSPSSGQPYPADNEALEQIRSVAQPERVPNLVERHPAEVLRRVGIDAPARRQVGADDDVWAAVIAAERIATEDSTACRRDVVDDDVAGRLRVVPRSRYVRQGNGAVKSTRPMSRTTWRWRRGRHRGAHR